MNWFNPVQKAKRILGINQIPYKNKVFEINGYYMWKLGYVSQIQSINGAVVKHTLYDEKGNMLVEQQFNSLQYFYDNTRLRVKPRHEKDRNQWLLPN
jgi:hypothetical protein